MQKREGFRAEVRTQPNGKSWVPPPRECATITQVGQSMFMIGGMNNEPIKEISRAKVMGDSISWEKVVFRSQEVIQGR